MPLSEREAVEVFHLTFLRQLAAAGDRSHFTVKGGCNLRFFFGSVRYSEDLDLDVRVIAQGTLKQKVDRLLISPAMALPLKSQGLSVVDSSTSKQTATTQRWKLGLAMVGRSIPLRTKVEFSRRGGDDEDEPILVEPIDPALARHYGIPPPLVQHYVATAAVGQKIRALVGRPETQARDVFDLQLLIAKLSQPMRMGPELAKAVSTAVERVMSLSYDDYRAQVVVYLLPEHAGPFEDRAAWDAMQSEVIAFLEGLQS